MIDIQAGDVVVCVKSNVCKCGCSMQNPLSVGALYRIATICSNARGEIGVTLKGVPAPSPHRGFSVRMFRKIKPATKEFTTRIKAVRPIKQREDA